MILKPKKKLSPKDLASIQGLIDHNGWHVPLSKILDVSPDTMRDWKKHGAPPGVAANLWLSLGAKRDNLSAAMYDILLDEPLKPWERAGQVLAEYEGVSDDPTMIYGDADENGNRDMVVRVIADLLHYCMDQMARKRIFIDMEAMIKEAIAIYNAEPHSAISVKTEKVRPGALIPYVLTADPAKIANFQKEFGMSQEAAVDILIEDTDWGAEDLPHLVGKKGTEAERLRELRRVLREAGQTEEEKRAQPTTEHKTPEEDYSVSLKQQREWMREDMPELLAGLEPLIKEYKLSDRDAHDLLFDAQCGHDSGVKDKNTIEGMAYDLKHGLRPEKK